jgi:MOSC domain-containing protein YiiM
LTAITNLVERVSAGNSNARTRGATRHPSDESVHAVGGGRGDSPGGAGSPPVSHIEGMMISHLRSLQVGQPRWLGTPGASSPLERPFWTAFDKRPVEGPLRLGTRGLTGDAQADKRHHGGEESAVLGYAAAHYPVWRSELGLEEMGPGGFGENFTLDGLAETSVSIGDTYALGEAIVQVSMPRIPCGNISRRWKRADLTARVRETGRTGWYFRVLEPGDVQAGMEVRLVERAFPRWTIALANELFKAPASCPAEAAELAECPLAAEAWRTQLLRRIERRNG